MPKVNGTRAQKAEEVFSRICNGPSFSHFGTREEFTTETAAQQFRTWSESWLITEVCKLVPELRGKLGKLGYVEPATIAAARRPKAT